ncbi:MAG: pilus assembly protein PilM, partial [Thermoguttaceae bacterium]|nr:pilus assembly protein PilM [Thermoguttaceae bacterium]
DKDYVKQLHQIFRKADLEIDGIIPNTLAQRNLILDNNELNDNIMLLDIGAGNTDIGIFDGNRFVYTNTIPLGGDSITNDIALVLDISVEEAEKLKKQYALAMKSFIDNDNDVILNTCNGISKTRTIKSSELIEIIEARIEVFKELAATLGLFRAPVEEESAQDDSLVEPLMTLLIDLRRAAKKNKDFATADEIRNRLKELGVSLEDRPGGVCVWTRERS